MPAAGAGELYVSACVFRARRFAHERFPPITPPTTAATGESTAQGEAGNGHAGRSQAARDRLRPFHICPQGGWSREVPKRECVTPRGADHRNLSGGFERTDRQARSVYGYTNGFHFTAAVAKGVHMLPSTEAERQLLRICKHPRQKAALLLLRLLLRLTAAKQK